MLRKARAWIAERRAAGEAISLNALLPLAVGWSACEIIAFLIASGAAVDARNATRAVRDKRTDVTARPERREPYW
jgi:hypothetical protein